MPSTVTYPREPREATEIRWGRTVLTGVGAGIAIFAGTLLLITPLLSVVRALPEPARPWLTVGLLGAVAFLVRHRWGTGSSTAAHWTANLIATASAILAAS